MKKSLIISRYGCLLALLQRCRWLVCKLVDEVFYQSDIVAEEEHNISGSVNALPTTRRTL
jgi:hypothetical protein